MPRVIDYYFTPVSPYMYLGHDRFVAIAHKHGATINVKPVDFAAVFAVSGGLPLAQRAPQRRAYRLVELRRWSHFLHKPMHVEPAFFPVNGNLAAAWILAAGDTSTAHALTLTGAVARAVWEQQRNIADAATLATIANECGLDAAGLSEKTQAPDIAARYAALTQEAIDRGVFGAPWFIYRDEPFWGQDRLDFLDRALAQ
jgi:2-hydroxychromene-2-carboxylate isomerase